MVKARVIKIEGDVVTLAISGGAFYRSRDISFPVKIGEELDAFDDGSDGRFTFVPILAATPQSIIINTTVEPAKKQYRANKWLYVVLAIFLGSFGAHKLAIGKKALAIG